MLTSPSCCGIRLLLALCLAAGGASSTWARKTVTIIAHRGNPTAFPENCLEGFKAAALVADAVKIDVVVSKDGRLVVLHDPTVERTTNGHGAAREMSLAQLRQLRLLQLGDPTRYGIPTVEEVLAVIPHGKLIIIERKEGQLQAFLDLFRVNGLIGRAYLEASDWDFLRAAKAAEPKMLLAPYKEEPWSSARLKEAKEMGADLVIWRWNFVPPQSVGATKRFKLKLFTFVAKDLANGRQMVQAGVDGIFVDDPDLFVRNRELLFSR